MSNKTQLQTNNTSLEALITRVNTAKNTAASLPEAGGGGGGDIETVTLTYKSLPEPGEMIHYLDNTMTLQSQTIAQNGSYEAMKGTIVVIEGCMGTNPFSSSCTFICGNSVCQALLATGGPA